MHSMHTEANPSGGTNTITCGALVLDLDGLRVTVGEQDIPVTLTEFLLLKELVRNPFRVFDRQALALVLKARAGSHSEQIMSPRAVDLHISRLRRKLSQAGYDGIKTMRFVGYRFVPAPAR